MTYEEIRLEAKKEKKSHFHQKMSVSEFGDFAVCQSDKAICIIDTNIVEYVSRRKWCKDSHGYLVANISGKQVRLHDFVMAINYRDKPDGMYVDHINRDKRDNRITNLRIVNPFENTLNLSLRSTNKSGVTGVCKAKNGRYRAYIKYAGKQVNLGYYKTIEEARAARLEGEQRFGYKNMPLTIREKCELEGRENEER